jgi:hypothetical protein
MRPVRRAKAQLQTSPHITHDLPPPHPPPPPRNATGGATDPAACPAAYPSGAPRTLCGHVSLVEIDGMMSYKQAVAFIATGDAAYATAALATLTRWAATNTVFGLRHRNGPLEAAWAVGSMARAAELLRSSKWPGYTAAAHAGITGWMTNTLLPQMDWYINTITPIAISNGRKNVYGNWHASVADAMASLGVLTDNRQLYSQGIALYKTTVNDYLKWGKVAFAAGRLVGETSETLRDIYHSLFGLGSLLQAAEAAWAQDEDVFLENGGTLAAALELHSRLITAGLAKDASQLPAGFQFYDPSMPKAPKGCAWQWSIDTQLWSAVNTTAPNAKCLDLNDGVKYVLGVTFLPAGIEIGYNHFVGRLGMKLPETARLLAAFPVDYYTFSWGLGTLTHANTAGDLWRAGLSRATLMCTRRGRRRAAAAAGGA